MSLVRVAENIVVEYAGTWGAALTTPLVPTAPLVLTVALVPIAPHERLQNEPPRIPPSLSVKHCAWQSCRGQADCPPYSRRMQPKYLWNQSRPPLPSPPFFTFFPLRLQYPSSGIGSAPPCTKPLTFRLPIWYQTGFPRRPSVVEHSNKFHQ